MKPIVVPSGPSFLVVGPDGVGKTTVCNHMSRMTGIPVWKCPNEKGIFVGRDIFGEGRSLIFDYQLTNFLPQTGYRVISDRSYPCERVYANVFGRKTDDVMLFEIDGRHSALGTKILHLFSSTLPREEDDIVPSTKYWEVKAEYDRFVEWTRCEVVSVDTAPMLEAYMEGGDLSQHFSVECLRALGEL